MKRLLITTAAALAVAFTPAAAQDLSAQPPAAAIAPLLLTEGTRVEIEIGQTLGSKLATRGERFSLRLAQPILVNGVVVAPAGALGAGEVVHAAPSKGGGKPGELLLAARYVEFDDVRIALRSLTVGGQGKDHTLATLVVAQGVGPFAMFIQGGEIEIPAGTLASAKVAASIELLPQSATKDPAK